MSKASEFIKDDLVIAEIYVWERIVPVIANLLSNRGAVYQMNRDTEDHESGDTWFLLTKPADVILVGAIMAEQWGDNIPF